MELLVGIHGGRDSCDNDMVWVIEYTRLDFRLR